VINASYKSKGPSEACKAFKGMSCLLKGYSYITLEIFY